MSQHWITWAQSLILHIQQKAFLDLILNHTNYESFMTTISLSDEAQSISQEIYVPKNIINEWLELNQTI